VFTVTKYASGYNNSDKSDDVPGEATLELFVKDASGKYTRVTTSNISASGINANTSFYFSSYSSAISYTYYLDNIVYTRKAREETPAE
jgi:hypothetical protein